MAFLEEVLGLRQGRDSSWAGPAGMEEVPGQVGTAHGGQRGPDWELGLSGCGSAESVPETSPSLPTLDSEREALLETELASCTAGHCRRKREKESRATEIQE